MKLLLQFLFLSFGALISWGVSAKSYVIGVEEIDYYPYYHLDNKEYRGFARELFDAFAKQEGITFTYRPLPITRLYRELKDGGVDFKFPDSPFWGKSEKTGANFSYSGDVVGYIDGVMVPANEKDITVDQFNKLGVVRGFSPWVMMSYIDKGKIKTHEVNSWKGLIKLALYGRVDGAYFNIAVGRYNLEKHFNKKDALVFASSLPHDKSNYKMSTIKHPELLDKLNQFLVSDEANKIRNKYQLEIYPAN